MIQRLAKEPNLHLLRAMDVGESVIVAGGTGPGLQETHCVAVC